MVYPKTFAMGANKSKLRGCNKVCGHICDPSEEKWWSDVKIHWWYQPTDQQRDQNNHKNEEHIQNEQTPNAAGFGQTHRQGGLFGKIYKNCIETDFWKMWPKTLYFFSLLNGLKIWKIYDNDLYN